MPPHKTAKGGAAAAAAGPSGKKALSGAAATPLDQLDAVVAKVSESLDLFYETNPELAGEATAALKELYDWARAATPAKFSAPGSLPSLLVDGFDAEQIWEQLKLWVDPVATKGEAALLGFLKYAEESSDSEVDAKAATAASAKAAAAAAAEDSMDDDSDEGLPSVTARSAAAANNKKAGKKAVAAAPAKPQSKKQQPKKQKKSTNAAIAALEADGVFNWADMERFADLGEAEEAMENGTEVAFEPEEIAAMRKEERRRRREMRAAGGDLSGSGSDAEADDEADDEDDEDVDLFGEVPGAKGVMFSDFFLPIAGTNADGEGDDDDDDDDDDADMDVDDAFGDDDEAGFEGDYASAYGGLGFEGDEGDEGEDEDEEEEEAEIAPRNKKSSRAPKSMMDADEDEEDDDDENDEKKTATAGTTAGAMAGMSPSGEGAQDATQFHAIDDTAHVADHLLSSYGKRQQAMSAQIAAIEQELVGPKNWDMVGETRAHKRGKDMLLSKELVVDYAMRPAEPITEEVTQAIEEILRTRIRDAAWDDVAPRVPLPEKAFKPKEEVSGEKSQFGLAEIYEREYLQLATQGTGEVEAKVSAQHAEISELFGALVHKLDALCNFHYTPKGRGVELSVVSSTPAVAMEEVLPMAVGTEDRVAPQEVFQATSHGLAAVRAEQSREEKAASRKKRKDAKRRHFDVAEEKDKRAALAGDEDAKKKLEQAEYQQRYKDATKSKVVSRGAKVDDTRYASSGAFFTKVQDQQVKDQAGIKVPRKKAGPLQKPAAFMQ